MAARIPIQHKSPFHLDPRPLAETSSSHAGLLATARAFRALKLPDLIRANLTLKQRQRGFTEAQFLETLVLLQTVGGDCPEDLSLLQDDLCLRRGLGYPLPKVSAMRTFLDRFHDETLAAQRPARAAQKSFILPSSDAVRGLQAVQAGLVGRVAKLYAAQERALRIATIDQDATIIESHKRSALVHYEGGRGYQPMVAVWAEADLVVADEFRDGNVPARQAPLTCAQMAFAALPATIRERYFRGDSACHEHELLAWLKHPERAQEPGGRIGFAVSAVLSGALAQALWPGCPKRRGGRWQRRLTAPGVSGPKWRSCLAKPGKRRPANPCGMWACGCSRRRARSLPTAVTAIIAR